MADGVGDLDVPAELGGNGVEERGLSSSEGGSDRRSACLLGRGAATADESGLANAVSVAFAFCISGTGSARRTGLVDGGDQQSYGKDQKYVLFYHS